MVPEEAHVAHPGAPPEDPLIGRTLNGRFHVVECIGVGGMGRVYKAVQEPLDRLVAVKVLSPTYSTAKDPDFKRRFSLEASMTSKLRHPNTVTVIDYGQTGDGVYYIAMEYLEGRTLSDVLKTQGALPWQRAVDIAQQVCRSLREAHRVGIIHRDLKPANVMLLDQDIEQDTVKVLDFGLVKSFLPAQNVDVAVTQAGIFLGSPQYMSPEQARNHVSPRSDIYSLGVVMFHMLTGRPPFLAPDSIGMIMQHINDPPPSFKALRPDLSIPSEVEVVVGTCLQKDPNNRYQSMDDLIRALRRASGQPEPSGIFSSPRSFPPTPSGGLSAVLSGPGPRVALALSAPSPSPQWADSSTVAEISDPGFSIDLASDAHSGTHHPRLFASVGRRKSSRLWWALAFMAAVALSFLVVFAISQRAAPSPTAATSGSPVAGPSTAAAAPKEGAGAAEVLAEGAPRGARQVRFRVQTQPNGSTVWLDGRKMGKTPLAFEIPAGPGGDATAELTFTLDGYHPLLVTAGGYGEVLLTQKLQRRSGNGPNIRAVEASFAAPAPPLPAPAPISPKPAPTEAAPAAVVEAAPPPPSPAPVPVVTVASAAPVPAPAPKPKANPNEPMAFAEGMTRPQQLSGVPPSYSREEMAARVEGSVQARCVVTAAGRLDRCRLLKSLPLADQAVLDSLATRRYKPATYQGAPVAVDYVLDVHVGPPPAFDAERMTPPTKLSGPDPEYTQQAIEHEVEGSVEVRCVVTATGRAHSCRVVKELPFMSRSVLEAIERRTYSPARFDGQALDVQYTFRLNFALPEQP